MVQSTSLTAATTHPCPVLQAVDVHFFCGNAWQQVGRLTGSSFAFAKGYTGSITTGELTSLRVQQQDGSSFRPERIRLDIVLPLLNYAGVIVPDCGRHYINVSKALDIRSPLQPVAANNIGHPFFALADEAGAFLFAFGLLDVDGAIEVRRQQPVISSRLALVGGDEPLVREVHWAGPAEAATSCNISFFCCDAAPTWFHALRRYTNIRKEREGLEYPENADAWNPTWCTWTAFGSHDLCAERVLANARVACELGIKNIILDDGWFGPGLDDDIDAPRDSVGRRQLNIGDYESDPEKFTDLPGLVKQLQDMGLKVLLWHAPLCVATTSNVYAELKPYMIHVDGKEYVSVNGMAQLCPACPEVRQRVAAETTRLLNSFGVDGFKVDLYNCLPPGFCQSTEHSHDLDDPIRAVEATMQIQWETATALKPDIIFELKQDYGNVRLGRLGTMVRAGDTAYDLDSNCRRCFYIQSYAPVVHNDYLITGPETTPEALSMIMVRLLTAGVPTFGNDLTTLTKPLLDTMARWLDFYHEHLALFQASREPQNNDLSVWQGGNASSAWVALLWQARELQLPNAPEVHLLNGTGYDRFYLRGEGSRTYRCTCSDAAGHQLPSEKLFLGDGSVILIPPGGRARLQSC